MRSSSFPESSNFILPALEKFAVRKDISLNISISPVILSLIPTSSTYPQRSERESSEKSLFVLYFSCYFDLIFVVSSLSLV